jgi:hypothetical protein
MTDRGNRRPRGLRISGAFTLFRDGKLICARRNLVVNVALANAARVAADSSPSLYGVTLMGFGNGTTTPALADTGLGGAAQYFNALAGGTTWSGSGSVTFNYQLVSTDYGAVPGLAVTEIGLFGNTGSAAMPASIGIVTTTWTGSNPYSVGAIIKDSNGNVQRVTTAGTSGSSAPSWATTVGSTTADNTATWTMEAAHTAPAGMWTHALVPSFSFNGTSNYSGTYTLTFGN